MMPTEEQTYRDGVLHKLDDLKTSIVMLDTKVSYTNGKVKKIIIALVFLGGIVVGQQFGDWHSIIALLASAV